MKRALIVSLALVCSAFPLLAFAQHADPEALKAAVKANSLSNEGNVPFHLKLNFQMFDLAGKATEVGTAEEWWVSPGVYRIVVVSPSLHFTIPADEPGPVPTATREKYFVEKLLQEAVHPLPNVVSAGPPVDQLTRTFGKIQLTCFVSTPVDASLMHSPASNYCVDPKSNTLRAEYQDDAFSVVRNTLGVFHETNVALDLQIAYQGRLAIAGKVAGLQSFDPAKVDLVLTTPSSSVVGSDYHAGVVVGSIIKKVQPLYPPMAKASHTFGTVVLHAIISKEGRVTGLFPLATSSPLLNDAATDAVQQWTYTPYMLNGQPTEVDTTISVNFTMSSQNRIQ